MKASIGVEIVSAKKVIDERLIFQKMAAGVGHRTRVFSFKTSMYIINYTDFCFLYINQKHIQ